jgi:GNAT superfamily N-acetyltransferase
MDAPRTIIRRANAGDADAATTVLRRSIIELAVADHRNDPERLESWLANKHPENFRSWLADPDNNVFVAVREGRIVGIGSVMRDGYIGLNYVAPDVRFSGVSRQMLAHLENEAERYGVARVYLTSTATAKRLYLGAGYRLRPGEDSSDPSSLPMEKYLSAQGEPQ